jgi:hypothetical protein
VDDKKMNSLRFAQIQDEYGVKGTYYFRMVPQSFDEQVIREIANLGHEIGYHYEDMDFALQRIKIQESRHKTKYPKEEDLYDMAIQIFEENLTTLRKLYPVKTVCMHGSPRSKFDNKALWKKYSYKDYGIIGEPYFDIDFNDVFYLTDTGRMWDGHKVSIRDKIDVNSGQGTSNQQPGASNQFPQFHSTLQINEAAELNTLPDKIMITFHPQRWTDNPISWMWELVFQNAKNQVKRIMVLKNNR